jgi:hypothetical protein
VVVGFEKGVPLRIVIAILTGVMAAGIAGGYQWVKESREHQAAGVLRARGAAGAIEREIRIRAATGGVEVNGRGWPTTVDVGWWQGRPPQNPLVPGDRPWLEIAGASENGLMHPPVRQSVHKSQAAFWYNPAKGVVRARVGPAVSDRIAIEVYNRVNGSSVAELFDTLWEAGNGDLGVNGEKTTATASADDDTE